MELKSIDEPRPPASALSAARNDPYFVWRNGNYRLYAVGWFLMTFARQIETVALGMYLYTLTRDPLSLGWLGLLQALPFVLLAIPAGQAADRLDRREVLMAMLALVACVSGGLWMATSQQAALGCVYGLIGVGAIGQAIGAPARAALLPQIVGRKNFANAVTWNSSIFQVAMMTGPAAGGYLMDKIDIPTAFAVVIGCRVLSLVMIAGVRTRSRVQATESLSLESLVAGIRFVRQSKLILATITLDLFAVLLGGATYLLPIFATDILDVGARGLGLLRSSEAVGAIFMAVLLAHLPPMRHAGRTLLWAVAGFGAATIVFGLSQWFWLSLLMMFFIGALDNISVVVRHTLVQMLTPDPMRGRVSAVNNVFIVASNDIGGLESGVTAKLVGPVLSVVAGGVGTILVVLTSMKIWPQILSIGALGDVRPAQAAKAQEQADEELAARP